MVRRQVNGSDLWLDSWLNDDETLPVYDYDDSFPRRGDNNADVMLIELADGTSQLVLNELVHSNHLNFFLFVRRERSKGLFLSLSLSIERACNNIKNKERIIENNTSSLFREHRAAAQRDRKTSRVEVFGASITWFLFFHLCRDRREERRPYLCSSSSSFRRPTLFDSNPSDTNPAVLLQIPFFLSGRNSISLKLLVTAGR